MHKQQTNVISKVMDLVISEVFWMDESNQMKTLKDIMTEVNCVENSTICFGKLSQADLFGAYNSMKIKAQDFEGLKSPDASKEELAVELKSMVFTEVSQKIQSLTRTNNIEEIKFA